MGRVGSKRPSYVSRLAAVVWLAGSGLLGCWGGSSAPATPPGAGLPGAEVGVTLALDSVTVGAAVRELSRAGGLALVIDPSAERFAACARVSLSVPSARPAREVVTLLGTALAGSGFTLAAHPEGLHLSHDAATRPVGCSPSGLDAPGTGLLDPSSPGTPTTPEDFALAVRAVSDTEWELTRAYRDGVSSEALMRSARVIPQEVDGQVVGLRVFGIRRSTLLGALGFQNGDTVRSVNGRTLGSPDTALEAYAELRDAERYEIVLERRGASRTHVVRIVDALSVPGAE